MLINQRFPFGRESGHDRGMGWLRFAKMVVRRAWAEACALMFPESWKVAMRDLTIFGLAVGLMYFLRTPLAQSGLIDTDANPVLENVIPWLFGLCALVAVFAAYFVLELLFVSPYRLWREAQAGTVAGYAEQSDASASTAPAPAPSLESTLIDYEHWDGQRELLLSQAASLWEGEEPDPHNMTLIGKPARRLEKLFADYRAKKLAPAPSYVKRGDVGESPYGVMVARDDLRIYVYRKHLGRPLFLFPEDRPVGTLTPGKLADDETKRLAGIVRAMSERTKKWSFATPTDPNDNFFRYRDEIRDSTHTIWVLPAVTLARREFLHACDLLGDREFHMGETDTIRAWREAVSDAERRLLPALMGEV